MVWRISMVVQRIFIMVCRISMVVQRISIVVGRISMVLPRLLKEGMENLQGGLENPQSKVRCSLAKSFSHHIFLF